MRPNRGPRAVSCLLSSRCLNLGHWAADGTFVYLAASLPMRSGHTSSGFSAYGKGVKQKQIQRR